MSMKFIHPGAGSNRQISIESGRSKFGWVVKDGCYFAWHPSKRSATRAAVSAAKVGPCSSKISVIKAKSTSNGGFEI